MSISIDFEVRGTPKPQGSKRHVGNGIMIESGGAALTTWREDVKHAAHRVLTHELVEPIDDAVRVRITFLLRRPASHYRSGKNAHLLRTGAPKYPHRKPDIDKLLRSTLDAITSAGLWRDDALAVDVLMTKTYCDLSQAPGAFIALDVLD